MEPEAAGPQTAAEAEAQFSLAADGVGLPEGAQGFLQDQLRGLKEEGNVAFKRGKWKEALSRYEAGLSLAGFCGGSLVVVLHSNSAECCLRVGDWQEAKAHAASALLHEPTHAKSQLRRAKAEAAMDVAAPKPGACGTASQVAAAVRHMRYLRRTEGEGEPAQRVGFLSAPDADRIVDIMVLMTPSIYQVMAEIVGEEADRLAAQLTGGTMVCMSQHLLTTVLRGDREAGKFSTSITKADPARCLAFLQCDVWAQAPGHTRVATGVWPELIRLADTLVRTRSTVVAETMTLPMFRFYGLMLAASSACAQHVLDQHCSSKTEVWSISALLKIGDEPHNSQLEGLMNQSAGVLAACAEASDTCPHFTTWLLEPLTTEAQEMYKKYGRPAGDALFDALNKNKKPR